VTTFRVQTLLITSRMRDARDFFFPCFYGADPETFFWQRLVHIFRTNHAHCTRDVKNYEFLSVGVIHYTTCKPSTESDPLSELIKKLIPITE